MTIEQHLEQYLGPIARGWGSPHDPGGLHVCRVEDRPVPAVVTYATLGLSRHSLGMPGGREVRQELLLSVAVRFADEDLPKLLAYIADGVLREHRALQHGTVLSLGYPVAKTSRCSSLYVAAPGVFRPELAVDASTQPPTVFAWLVPIHPAEADLVAQRGWNELEDRLERTDNLDVFDIERQSIV